MRGRIIALVAAAARWPLPGLVGSSPRIIPTPTSRALVAAAPSLLRTPSNHWRHTFDVRRGSDTHAHIPFTEAPARTSKSRAIPC
jgi:hypothetical protein